MVTDGSTVYPEPGFVTVIAVTTPAVTVALAAAPLPVPPLKPMVGVT